MKNVLFFLAFLLTIHSCENANSSQDSKNQTPKKITEEEALNLLHTWTDAYLAGDAAPLNEILDDTWLYSGSADGKTSDKKSTIEEFSNADYSFSDITYQDLKVQLYDDIAVVRGTEKMVIVGGSGDTTILRLRFTDVYQKKDGTVKAIATHSSPINEE